MDRPVVTYVDVDDTLIRSVGSKRIPMSGVVAHVRSLKEEGAILYCWSTGGADYARQSAEEVGLHDCFVDFLPKPNILVDDREVKEWRTCITIHPLNSAGQTLDSYREKMARH